MECLIKIGQDDLEIQLKFYRSQLVRSNQKYSRHIYNKITKSLIGMVFPIQNFFFLFKFRIYVRALVIIFPTDASMRVMGKKHIDYILR